MKQYIRHAGICLVAVLAVRLSFAQESREGRQERTNPVAGQKESIQAGSTRYKQGCAMCHGGNAEGGRGPALVRNRDLYRMNDGALFNVIEHGIPGTSMPPSNLPEKNVWEIAAYVRSLSSPVALSPVDGDPQAGQNLFYGRAGCNGCHAIRGNGGSIAPDLSGVGARLTAKDLRESIVDPSAEIAEGFQHVTVQFPDGKTLDGVAKDDSDYSMTILDKGGNLHEISKSSVQEIIFHKKSLMPDHFAQQLGPDGVDNIMAFLAQQVARPGEKIVQRRRLFVQ